MTNKVDFTGHSVDGRCYCVMIDKTKVTGNIHTTCGGIIDEKHIHTFNCKEAKKHVKHT